MWLRYIFLCRCQLFFSRPPFGATRLFERGPHGFGESSAVGSAFDHLKSAWRGDNKGHIRHQIDPGKPHASARSGVEGRDVRGRERPDGAPADSRPVTRAKSASISTCVPAISQLSRLTLDAPYTAMSTWNRPNRLNAYGPAGRGDKPPAPRMESRRARPLTPRHRSMQKSRLARADTAAHRRDVRGPGTRAYA